MSKEKRIVTINGEDLPIFQCRKFDAGYYKIGDPRIENSGDCYLIGGKYYRVETGQIVYDVEHSHYVPNNGSLTHGIVALEKDGYKLGYFTVTEKNIVVHTPAGQYYAYTEDVLKVSKEYRERIHDGNYYHISLIEAKEFGRKRPPSNEYKHSLQYDSRYVLDRYMDRYNKTSPLISPNIENYAKILKDYTFGLEFETTAGFIPDRLLNHSGMIPLRDGSISGLEYVTVPMSGVKGLQMVVNSAKLLKDRTKYDNTCSFHQHVGGIPRTKEFILAFFKATCAVQDEIYEMFPLYKKYNFRVKRKNYSKPYPIFDLISQMDTVINVSNINENFNVLYMYLSQGQHFSEVDYNLNNITGHPRDMSGQQKWNIDTRYYIHNLIPLIFGNKATVEFRIHTPTFDVNKIVPFMFINILFTDFVVQNQKKILEDKSFLPRFGLSEMIFESIRTFKGEIKNLDKLSSSLANYIEQRKIATERQNQRGNIVGNEEAITSAIKIDWESEVKVEPEVVNVTSDSYGSIRTDRPSLLDIEAEEYERTVQRLKQQMEVDMRKSTVSRGLDMSGMYSYGASFDRSVSFADPTSAIFNKSRR